MQETGLRSLGQEDPLGQEMATHSEFLPGKSHGQRSLEGYSPWGHKRVKHNLLTEQQPLPKQTGVPLNPQAHLNLLVKITHSISHHENCTLRSAKNNQTLPRIQEGFSIY